MFSQAAWLLVAVADHRVSMQWFVNCEYKAAACEPRVFLVILIGRSF